MESASEFSLVELGTGLVGIDVDGLEFDEAVVAHGVVRTRAGGDVPTAKEGAKTAAQRFVIFCHNIKI